MPQETNLPLVLAASLALIVSPGLAPPDSALLP